MAELTKVDDVRDVIREHLKQEGRSFKWLSDRIRVNYNTLYSILVKKESTITPDKLERINAALGTNFNYN